VVDNVLVCGGLPKAATTFLFTEIKNYERVFNSRIKETYLFERSEKFIDNKLKGLRSDLIYLDFTPDYIFNREVLKKLLIREIKCFFVIRDYDEYMGSLKKYLSINKINNNNLLNLSRDEYEEAVDYVSAQFIVYPFELVKSSQERFLKTLSKDLDLDFGKKITDETKKNSSEHREHYALSSVHNYFNQPMKLLKSSLFGVL
jgi:hypothetical protein